MDVVYEKSIINSSTYRLEKRITNILNKNNIPISPDFFDCLYSRRGGFPLIELELTAAIFNHLDKDKDGITIYAFQKTLSKKTDRLAYYKDLLYNTSNEDKIQIIGSMDKVSKACYNSKEGFFDHLCKLERIFSRSDLPLLAKVLKCFDEIEVNNKTKTMMISEVLEMQGSSLKHYFDRYFGDQTGKDDELSIQVDCKVGEGSSSLSFFGSSTTTSAVSKDEDLSEKKSDNDKSNRQDKSQEPKLSTLHK